MLNLHKNVTFSLSEYRHIQSIIAKGVSGPDMWKINNKKEKSIKHHISEFTIRNQKGRCVYCESILRKGDTAIEHFAPKEKNDNFTFHPKNLFSACGCCNAPVVKGRNDTISSNPKHPKYKKNNFSIVHPLFDNPDDHIKYKDADRTIFDLNACTQKGLDTINFFKWNTISAYLDRVNTANSRSIPIPINQLIQEISTYK